MKYVLIFCALGSTGYSATVKLDEMVGDLCKESTSIALFTEGQGASLSTNLETNAVVEVQGETLTLRRNCTFKLTVAPGEGQKVSASSLALKGAYTFGKSGRVFLSVAERTLASFL